VLALGLAAEHGLATSVSMRSVASAAASTTGHAPSRTDDGAVRVVVSGATEWTFDR
jgi:hypothetical protein